MAMACQAIPIWMGMTWHAIHTNMDGCEVSSKTYMDGRDVATDIYIYVDGRDVAGDVSMVCDVPLIGPHTID